MRKVTFKSVLSCAAVVCAMSLFTSCDEVMSKLDNPVSSYLTVNQNDGIVLNLDTIYQITASTINSDKPVTYKSSDTKIATVDANGLVTPVAEGDVEITVAVEASDYYTAGEQKVKIAVMQPLTFEALEDGTINVNYNYGITLDEPIYYSFDRMKTKKAITTTTPIPVKKGQKIQFESANDHTGDYGPYDFGYGTYNTNRYVSIQPQSKCAVYGNLMSMITPDGNYYTNKTITKPYALQYLLQGNYNWDGTEYVYYTLQHDKYDLLLPATELTYCCYYYTLAYTGIKKAPVLPATKLAYGCYEYMFANCSSLKKAPALPVTDLESSCYQGMFQNCTSLTEAPALPATTLAPSCYRTMFNGCTSLKKAPALPAKEMTNYCYYSMFNGCTALEAAPALPATTLADYCYRNMFYRCTSLKKAPALPATTLAYGCYQAMFQSCYNMEGEIELPAETLTYQCYSQMFYGCSKLSKVTCLAKGDSDYRSLYYWLRNAGTAVDSPVFVRNTDNSNWANNNGYGNYAWYVPTNWTITPAIE